MKTAFIIHGTGGHSQENWFPWLKSELEKLGFQTIVPDFGSEEKPNIANWKKIFSKYEDTIDGNTLLIGHSLGGAFLLKFLEGFLGQAHLLAIVSSPIGIKPIKFYEGDYDFLDGFDFNWKNITPKINEKIVFHSDNDPYVSLGNGKKLSQKLGTELIFIPQSGHFNAAAGFTEFTQLLEEIKKYI